MTTVGSWLSSESRIDSRFLISAAWSVGLAQWAFILRPHRHGCGGCREWKWQQSQQSAVAGSGCGNHRCRNVCSRAILQLFPSSLLPPPSFQSIPYLCPLESPPRPHLSPPPPRRPLTALSHSSSPSRPNPSNSLYKYINIALQPQPPPPPAISSPMHSPLDSAAA